MFPNLPSANWSPLALRILPIWTRRTCRLSIRQWEIRFAISALRSRAEQLNSSNKAVQDELTPQPPDRRGCPGASVYQDAARRGRSYPGSNVISIAKPCGAVGLVTTYAMGTHRAAKGLFFEQQKAGPSSRAKRSPLSGSTGRNPISYRRGALGSAERAASSHRDRPGQCQRSTCLDASLT